MLLNTGMGMNFTFWLLLIALVLFSSAELQGQDKVRRHAELPPYRTCATVHPPLEFEEWMSRKRALGEGLSDVEYTIPVIVHVIHSGQPVGTDDNITYQQIMSQLDVLNEDYNRTNADTIYTPAGFVPVAGRLKVNFCPAVVGPDGNILPEPGVNRIRRQDKGFPPPPFQKAYVDTLIKPVTIWDPNEYLNIWVMRLANNILGFATFPNPLNTGIPGIPPGTYGTAIQDGVVIHTQVFGRIGNVQYPYNLGRTCTHEVGHWLGLKHVWGDGLGNGCLSDDFCDDTPNQEGPTTDFEACPAFPTISCNNGPLGNMFMNYMDYSDDGCMNIFTRDQVARMRTVLEFSAMRANLIQSPRCNVPSARDARMELHRPVSGDSLCADAFRPQLRVRNNGSEVLTSFTVNYRLNDGPLQQYDWNGSIAFGKTAIVTLPELSLGGLGNYTLDATLVLPNGGADGNTADNSDMVSFKKVMPITPSAVLPVSEGFQSATFPPAGWKYNFPNPDYRWRRTTVAGGFGQSTASMRMDNYSSPDDISGQKDVIELPPFDFSGNDNSLLMRFDVAYARYDFTTNDTLNIYASTDCGLTWDTLYSKGGQPLATGSDTGENPFVPTAGQWRKDSVSLADYAGLSPVLLRIENVSQWGNYLYMDNIQVYSSQHPVGIADHIARDFSFSLFPNPASRMITLETKMTKPDEYSLHISNILGQVVYSHSQTYTAGYSRQEINLGSYARGVYFVTLSGDGKLWTEKLILD